MVRSSYAEVLSSKYNEKERKMSNQWAQRKASQKRDRMETARSLQTLVNDQFAVKGYSTKREVNERPATAAKRERAAFYGKFNPENPICPNCFMIVSASGACSGMCFD